MENNLSKIEDISKKTNQQIWTNRPEVINFFLCSNAHKYKNIKNLQLSSDSNKPIMLFSLLINVKMPTIVGILTFMSRKNFMLN